MPELLAIENLRAGYGEAVVLSRVSLTVPEGRTEYIEFLTPAGVSWVVGLDDNGDLYIEQFGTGRRRSISTVMHKGTLLWVADNRFQVPGSR